jgi:DNA topoisomerase-3
MNSKFLSADVNAAFDPNYPTTHDKLNAAYIGKGIVLTKYTGSRGKSGSNDASAEFVGEIRRIFNENNICWQMGELGKVDEGGGGTIAYIPAKYGMDVIDVLGERDITSPGLTAIWEERLGKIEDGELSYEDFYDDMISYTEEQTINISKEVDKNLNGEKMVLGKCPKCGEDVIKGKKYYLCSKYKDTCDFIIGKEFFGVKISDKDVEKILQGETTRKMNFTFKNGKKGTGRLQYNKEEKNIKIIFEKKERKKIGKCPKCGEEMIDGKSYYICSKYKDTCDFIVGKKILGANVGIADIKALISGKETGEKEFTWKSGKKGNAKLKLNEDGKIKFVFSNNKE